MGFFSWKTSDTRKSVPNIHSSRKAFTIHMITEYGQVFTEPAYDGYGEFGGMDIYVLIAELNGIEGANNDEKRIKAIDLLHKTILTDGEKVLECGKDFTNWGTPIKGFNKTANELVEAGWTKVYPNGYGDFNAAAKKGISLPKLVQTLPSADSNWKEFWDKLPYPKDCENQGYFY